MGGQENGVEAELIEEDPADLKTMQEFVKLGSLINPDVQLTGDCPSNYPSGKMPALNTQLWVEDNKIMHEHYSNDGTICHATESQKDHLNSGGC